MNRYVMQDECLWFSTAKTFSHANKLSSYPYIRCELVLLDVYMYAWLNTAPSHGGLPSECCRMFQVAIWSS